MGRGRQDDIIILPCQNREFSASQSRPLTSSLSPSGEGHPHRVIDLHTTTTVTSTTSSTDHNPGTNERETLGVPEPGTLRV